MSPASSASRGSNVWRLEAWGEACKLSHVTEPIYLNGPRCTIRREILEAFRLLGAVFVAHGYVVRRIGAYNCRKITGGTIMSAHAWGIAVDVNDDTNPYRTDRLVTDMSPAMIDDVLDIRTRDGVQVWRWGGGWGVPYDAMHFEVVCTPEELAVGFEAAVIAPKSPHSSRPGQPVTAHRFPVLSRGSKGVAVSFLQELLGMERLGNGRGEFGPRTEEAVRLYQASRRLAADGVVGLATWTAILTGQPQAEHGSIPPQKARAEVI